MSVATLPAIVDGAILVLMVFGIGDGLADEEVDESIR